MTLSTRDLYEALRAPGLRDILWAPTVTVNPTRPHERPPQEDPQSVEARELRRVKNPDITHHNDAVEMKRQAKHQRQAARRAVGTGS